MTKCIRTSHGGENITRYRIGISVILLTLSSFVRADVCDDFRTALAMNEGAFHVYNQQTVDQLSNAEGKSQYDAALRAAFAAQRGLDDAATAVRRTITEPESTTIYALYAIVELSTKAWNEFVSANEKHYSSQFGKSVTRLMDSAKDAYFESLKIACQ